MKSWDASLPADEMLFFTSDEVVAIHERLVDAFGGTPGLRDPASSRALCSGRAPAITAPSRRWRRRSSSPS